MSYLDHRTAHMNTLSSYQNLNRHDSVTSTNSSAYTSQSSTYLSRNGTISSAASSAYSQGSLGHKRGHSDFKTMAPSGGYGQGARVDRDAQYSYKNARESLRPLPQAPTTSSSPQKAYQHREPAGSLDRYPQFHDEDKQTYDGLSESPPRALPSRPHRHHASADLHSRPVLQPDLQELEKSSTGYLRTLSKFAANTESQDFSMKPTGPSVVGLQGRRQLKRTDSTAGVGRQQAKPGGLDWSDRNWMDKQRQFLQAYEYLCHIGEAKEWIEDIIHQPIPQIVELEEALRNGVTLAEIVQALNPDQKLRICRMEKLNFRHSDNIDLFFRYLEEVGLPELFRFELIDLYEKKNIPKVIYCIHALSWLLYRLEIVDFRIGNLVGQLQFEQHELEQTQRGLDKAGVSMPTFKGMGESFGAAPEPEPVESEEERLNRELNGHGATILELQSQIRGALVRVQLGDTMNTLWESEAWLIDLQSRIRADWARQVIQYRLTMQQFATKLQASARGFLIRSSKQQKAQTWKAHERNILTLQSLVRARKARSEVKSMRFQIQRNEPGVKSFQSAIRGALARRKVDNQFEEARMSEAHVEGLQAMIRGAKARTEFFDICKELKAHTQSLVTLQSWVRAANSREEYHALRLALFKQSQSAVQVQTTSRAFIARQRHARTLNSVRQHEPQILALQSLARAAAVRTHVGDTLSRLGGFEIEIRDLQALSRAMISRLQVSTVLNALDEHDSAIVDLQTFARASMLRARFAEKQRFFRENMEKVVKIQSVVRAKIQGQAYKSLTSGKNPPAGTLKGFVHLLNDSDFDFDEEIEFERMRKTVVQQVRQNELADQYITQLDIKIALLVKNKITLDEVVKHQKHFGGHIGTLLPNADLASKDPFDLKALNKTSRQKLEHYQELFFLLQTQPQYLSRLFRRIREQGTPEKELERIKHLVMGLFGYAQKRREEYYLVKLIARSVREEVEASPSLQDYVRSNCFCNKLFSAYVKSPRDRKYLRDLLGPLIKDHFLDKQSLDLESDPLQIYISSINNEELRTGQRSRRDPNVPREEAIRDPETRATFIHHMQDLRDICDQFFLCLEDTLGRMPFGVRYIVQQTYEQLRTRFHHEEPGFVLQMVGQWIWRQYLQSALMEPDKFGVVDRGMTQEQRRNLGEVTKVLNQAVSGREFGGDNIYLQPLNTYIAESACRFADVWNEVISIPPAEEHYDIDEFNDLYAKTKPTLYIKMADIFSMHQLLASGISSISPNQDDVLRDILRELGSVKSNESELMGVSTSEISLTLTPKLHNADDPDAEVKTLMTETKRCVLHIIRVQSGNGLLDILVKPVTDEDESRWEALVQEELLSGGSRRGAYAEASTTLDISTLTYPELKSIALENVLQLESVGRLSRSNQYQDLLNDIAVDIRTKHRRRLQRQREIEGVRTTLARLDEQAAYLAQQLKTYNDYIEQAMVTLQSKKGKKRFLMPFTKQWDHERELQRSGRSFKFGSYKYSARKLAEKGVLVHWRGYAEQQWDRVDLTISSNEVGVFTIDGSSGNMMIPSANAQIPLDDLLQAQFNNAQFMEFFEGALRVNVNLFLHLIMKKFYNE